MSNQLSTQTLSFHGSDLITLKVDDVIYTAVKPIVEALGLSWGTQQQKLSRSKEKFNCVHMSTVTNGGIQEMLCMPLKKLNGWLFSINPEKVRPDLKEKVIRYQEECFEALYNYWHFGKAERQQLALPKPEKKYTFEFTEYEIQLLLWLWFSNYNTHELLDMLIEPLEYIGSRYASTVYSHKTEYARFIDESVEIIYRLTKDFHKSRDENWVNPLSGVRSVIFHQKEMRKKHEAKMKKAEEKRFPHTNF